MPSTSHRILCAVDLGPSATAALRWAAARASQSDRELYVISVLPSLPPLPPAAGYVDTGRLDRDRLSKARADLTALLENTLGGLAVASSEVRVGVADAVILSRAAELSASLLCIGAPRKMGAPMLGSCGARLLRAAPMPVASIPASDESSETPAAGRWIPARSPLTKVLVPTDLGPTADAALAETLGHLRALTSAELEVHLVHVLDMPGYVMRQDPLRESLAQSVRAELHDLASRHRTLGFHVHPWIEQGSAGDAIAHRAKELEVDLIAVPAHSRGAVARFFLGSVAERIARAAVCPTLTYHPAAMNGEGA